MDDGLSAREMFAVPELRQQHGNYLSSLAAAGIYSPAVLGLEAEAEVMERKEIGREEPLAIRSPSASAEEIDHLRRPSGVMFERCCCDWWAIRGNGLRADRPPNDRVISLNKSDLCV